MNKKLLSVMAMLIGLGVTGCAKQQEVKPLENTPPTEAEIETTQVRTIKKNSNRPGTTAYYRDWDAAIRVDVDLHNMYEATPTKIEKPIDMYLAMALALKYNYTRRLASYQQSLLDAGYLPYNKIPDILSKAGYRNTQNLANLNSDLKVAWNALDLSSLYLFKGNPQYKAELNFQENRKVMHNIMQEARNLYWRALAAQRLIPVMDEMIEVLTLEVDEMNIKSKELAAQGQSLSSEALVNKRDYMEAIKKTADLKHSLEDSEIKLASFMGFHPNTELKLVGSEYGNFALPEIKQNLADLEWLALTSRPELRAFDIGTNIDDLKIQIKELQDPDVASYKSNPAYYNEKWGKAAQEITIEVFEDAKKASANDLKTLRRERATEIVLSQLYVAWAQYMSAIEAYEIRKEIANTSEDIAEDVTISLGSYADKSKLEAARAIDDEVKAFLAYADVQDALGNLYASIGLDALPYDMYKAKASTIALTLKDTLKLWQQGKFQAEEMPAKPIMPSKRPAINLTSPNILPDIEVQTGERFSVTLPPSVFDRLNLKGRVTTSAALDDGSPLPEWMSYDEESYTISGVGMPSNVGEQRIKIYVTDEGGNVGYITFSVKLDEYYSPSMEVRGLTRGRSAEVFKRCTGESCSDSNLGTE